MLKESESRLAKKTGVSAYQMFKLHGAAKNMKKIAKEKTAAQV